MAEQCLPTIQVAAKKGHPQWQNTCNPFNITTDESVATRLSIYRKNLKTFSDISEFPVWHIGINICILSSFWVMTKNKPWF